MENIPKISKMLNIRLYKIYQNISKYTNIITYNKIYTNIICIYILPIILKLM